MRDKHHPWSHPSSFSPSRLLRLIDLPSLDAVLSHSALDGKLIVRNVYGSQLLSASQRHLIGAEMGEAVLACTLSSLHTADSMGGMTQASCQLLSISVD